MQCHLAKANKFLIVMILLRYKIFTGQRPLLGCSPSTQHVSAHVSKRNTICVVLKQHIDGQCVSSGRLHAPLFCFAVALHGAGPMPGTLRGDWSFQAGPWSLPSLTHFQRCTTSMTFTALQGRVVHLQGKTNKYGGCRSASVQTLFIWLSVSMAPQHLWYCCSALRLCFGIYMFVQHYVHMKGTMHWAICGK